MENVIMYKFKYPSQIGIEITNKCNFHCEHCINSSSEHDTLEMPLWKIKEIIDYMHERQLICLDISGGEPLLHPDFHEIIEYGYSKGMAMSVASNGYILSPEVIALLLRCEVNLRISYDGYDEKSYALIRGNGKFETVRKNILLAVESGIPTTLITVLHSKNINHLFKFIENAKALNAVKLRFIPFAPSGRGSSSNLEMISTNEWKNIIENHKKWWNEYGIEIAIDSPLMAIAENIMCPCMVGKLYLVIKTNGNAIPCALLNIPLGNIYETDIDQIWNNEIFDELNDTSLLKEDCENCEYKITCAGGCRGLSYLLKNDYLCKDPFCWIQSQSK
ncbi:MAG: radical SAM/SPASM domain-containing protein [Hyphomicrobiales bacterium]